MPLRVDAFGGFSWLSLDPLVIRGILGVLEPLNAYHVDVRTRLRARPSIDEDRTPHPGPRNILVFLSRSGTRAEEPVFLRVRFVAEHERVTLPLLHDVNGKEILTGTLAMMMGPLLRPECPDAPEVIQFPTHDDPPVVLTEGALQHYTSRGGAFVEITLRTRGGLKREVVLFIKSDLSVKVLRWHHVRLRRRLEKYDRLLDLRDDETPEGFVRYVPC